MDSNLYEEIGRSVERAKRENGSLTDQNLLYVVKVATDVSKKTGVDFDFLLAEGVIGMKEFEKRYDPSQHDTFAKAAAMSVRGYMLNAINRQGTIVHIPVNHMQGFKKGQEKSESAAAVEYVEIDSTNYDSLGSEDMNIFEDDREKILQMGLDTLDINGRTAMEMKLRLGKYSEMTRSDDNPGKMVYKYSNNIESIADELEVPVKIANKIYKEALKKLSKYCQASCNE